MSDATAPPANDAVKPTPGRGPGGGGPFLGPGGHGLMAGTGAKSKDMKGALQRLGGYLKPHRVSLMFVVLFTILSVALNVTGPRVLGMATNLLFEGVISSQFFEGSTRQEVVADLRAEGRNELADMLENMTFTPGEGVDFDAISRLLLLLAGIYVSSAFFGWAQGYIIAGVAQETTYGLRKRADEKLA
ncbi:MAG: multidrug ABC transporter ATP-binding protein, partial [Actinobacteria bacterium HGW-Actinobacteria-10]